MNICQRRTLLIALTICELVDSSSWDAIAWCEDIASRGSSKALPASRMRSASASCVTFCDKPVSRKRAMSVASATDRSGIDIPAVFSGNSQSNAKTTTLHVKTMSGVRILPSYLASTAISSSYLVKFSITSTVLSIMFCRRSANSELLTSGAAAGWFEIAA